MSSTQRVLGIDFFDGAVREAVDTISAKGGLLVAPSGTCFARLQRDPDYRQAVTSADLALADSGFMVALWRILRRRRITRISGLAYLKELLAGPDLRSAGSTVWVLPNNIAQEKAKRWLDEHGFLSGSESFYVAPIYGARAEDSALLARIRSQRPAHVVIGLGGGVQEKLGSYLREKYVVSTDFRSPTSDLRDRSHRPAIHCIGGALGIVTGDQKPIPDWADRFYLGWLLRLLANPRVFIPRLWDARLLPFLLIKYGEELPPISTSVRN
ncbi:MAG: N-acetylglucosaminyldiphosphoundecaprenol N-acetyl-beta-D-mannosaminyltransferase [Verrucomicrobiota bacterium]